MSYLVPTNSDAMRVVLRKHERCWPPESRRLLHWKSVAGVEEGDTWFGLPFWAGFPTSRNRNRVHSYFLLQVRVRKPFLKFTQTSIAACDSSSGNSCADEVTFVALDKHQPLARQM